MLIKGQRALRKDIHNILLIQLGDIGDVVLSLPCIKTLHDNFPNGNVVVAVREKARELVEDCQWATDVISVDKKRRTWVGAIAYQRGFWQKLRKFRFDLAVDLRTGTRGAMLALFSGAHQRLGFHDEGVVRNLAFSGLVCPQAKSGQHLAEYYHSLLDAYDLDSSSIWPKHRVPSEKKTRVVALFQKEKIPADRPIVAVQPFSLWQYKDWAPDKYVALINRICSELGLPIIVTGSFAENDRAKRIVEKCRKGCVHNLAGKTSIGMLAAVLKACTLFIGGDSAGIHLAAAVGTATVSIFGPSSSVAWAPRGEFHRVVQTNLACVPCNKKGCAGDGVSPCLEKLSVEEVFSAARELLARQHQIMDRTA
jgi:heptosyltransferase-3